MRALVYSARDFLRANPLTSYVEAVARVFDLGTGVVNALVLNRSRNLPLAGIDR